MDFEIISRKRYREHAKKQARAKRALIIGSAFFGIAWFLLVVASIIVIQAC